MARDREKEKQLVDRFNALIDEGRYDDALKVAQHASSEVDPNGVTPVVALDIDRIHAEQLFDAA